MNWELQHRVHTPNAKASDSSLYVAGLCMLGGLLAWVWTQFSLPTPNCQFRELTGVPCVTCGATRMVEASFAGDLFGALQLNPLLFLVAMLAITWGAVALLLRAIGRRLSIRLEPGDLRRYVILALIAVAANWAYVIWVSSS